jgi:hypothetical protein
MPIARYVRARRSVTRRMRSRARAGETLPPGRAAPDPRDDPVDLAQLLVAGGELGRRDEVEQPAPGAARRRPRSPRAAAACSHSAAAWLR